SPGRVVSVAPIHLPNPGAPMPSTRSRPRGIRRAVTLIELLGVNALIAGLIGLLLPALQQVRGAAALLKGSNNLKQVPLGCLNYEVTNGFYPRNLHGGTFATGGGNQSWLFQALGYTEDNNLYNQVLAAGSFANARAARILPASTKLTRCPSDGYEVGDGKY